MKSRQNFLDKARRRLHRSLAPAELQAYSGVYSTFAEARSDARMPTSYEDGEYARRISEDLERRLSRLKDNLPPEKDTALNRLMLLPLITGAMRRPGNLPSILDIGGGPGLGFVECLYSLGENSFEYFLYELPSSAEVARRLLPRHGIGKNFHVLEQIPEQRNFDIVYFGSSLMYFENYSETFVSALRCSKDTVFVTCTPATDRHTFVTRQTNLADRELIIWVLSIKELESLARKEGFQLITQTAHPMDHDFGYLPEPFNESRHMNLLFRRMASV